MRNVSEVVREPNLRGVASLAGMARAPVSSTVTSGAAKAGLQYSFILGAERLELAVAANAPPAASKSPRPCH